MLFSSLRCTGHGSSHTPIAIDHLVRLGLTGNQFKNICAVSSRKLFDLGKQTMELKMENYVVFENVGVYQFHVYIEADIEQENVPATEEQAYEILEYSHSQLMERWEIQREAEVNIFPSLLPLTNEQVSLFVPNLVQTLNAELK